MNTCTRWCCCAIRAASFSKLGRSADRIAQAAKPGAAVYGASARPVPLDAAGQTAGPSVVGAVRGKLAGSGIGCGRLRLPIPAGHDSAGQLGGELAEAPRYLLEWHPVKTVEPAEGEAIAFVSEYSDYYLAPRTLAKSGQRNREEAAALDIAEEATLEAELQEGGKARIAFRLHTASKADASASTWGRSSGDIVTITVPGRPTRGRAPQRRMRLRPDRPAGSRRYPLSARAGHERQRERI